MLSATSMTNVFLVVAIVDAVRDISAPSPEYIPLRPIPASLNSSIYVSTNSLVALSTYSLFIGTMVILLSGLKLMLPYTRSVPASISANSLLMKSRSFLSDIAGTSRFLLIILLLFTTRYTSFAFKELACQNSLRQSARELISVTVPFMILPSGASRMQQSFIVIFLLPLVPVIICIL